MSNNLVMCLKALLNVYFYVNSRYLGVNKRSGSTTLPPDLAPRLPTGMKYTSISGMEVRIKISYRCPDDKRRNTHEWLDKFPIAHNRG
jgi:hypothetical protein